MVILGPSGAGKSTLLNLIGGIEQIVYSARAADVITTVVNGRVLMDDRKLLTIDTKQVFDLVQRCSHDLYARSFPDRI